MYISTETNQPHAGSYQWHLHVSEEDIPLSLSSSSSLLASSSLSSHPSNQPRALRVSEHFMKPETAMNAKPLGELPNRYRSLTHFSQHTHDDALMMNRKNEGENAHVQIQGTTSVQMTRTLLILKSDPKAIAPHNYYVGVFGQVWILLRVILFYFIYLCIMLYIKKKKNLLFCFIIFIIIIIILLLFSVFII